LTVAALITDESSICVEWVSLEGWSDDDPNNRDPQGTRRRCVYFLGQTAEKAPNRNVAVGFVPVSCPSHEGRRVGNTVKMQRPNERYVKGAKPSIFRMNRFSLEVGSQLIERETVTSLPGWSALSLTAQEFV